MGAALCRELALQLYTRTEYPGDALVARGVAVGAPVTSSPPLGTPIEPAGREAGPTDG